MSNEIISHIVGNAKSFSNIKRDGVGQTTILKFLKGSIPQWRIADKTGFTQQAIQKITTNTEIGKISNFIDDLLKMAFIAAF